MAISGSRIRPRSQPNKPESPRVPEGRQKAISLDEIYKGEQKAVTQDHPFLFKKTGHLSPIPCETLNPQVYGVSR